MIREKVKNLWKLCFNDSEEFTELYFRLRYNNDINIAIQSGEEVIAALQMLPYPMTFEGEDIHTAYISGACTHPDYRNRGVMHELLSQAFARMLHNNVALSTDTGRTVAVRLLWPQRLCPRIPLCRRDLYRFRYTDSDTGLTLENVCRIY